MIQKIIGKHSESEVFEFIRTKVRNYKAIYVLVLVAFLAISILPFHFNWVKSASTDPQEAVARLERPDGGMGTAFLISPTQLLTARHVVEGFLGEKVTLSFEQAKIPFIVEATIAYYENVKTNINQEEYFESDVAILTVNNISQISPLNLGNSDNFKTGEIVTMGYGNDDWSEPDGKITSNSYHKNNKFFKLDASVNAGHSGSPVLSKDKNEVIGIVVGKPNAVYSLTTQGQILEGENIVLKINQADRILQSGGYIIR